MTYGSLFSGIGGIDLGLDRAGMICRWQVEKDDYARRVLEKHWPGVPKYRDVRYFLGGGRWRAVRSAWAVDLVCGGFPCQDISNAGRRAGIGGARSGLWSEFARVVGLLRPRFVLVENVPALTIRGLGRVLGDLADLGFDAEWDRIPAAAVGAPHLRWRLFVLAHATGVQRPAVERGQPDRVNGLLVPDADRAGLEVGGRVRGDTGQEFPAAERGGGGDVPDPDGGGREVPQQVFAGQRHADEPGQEAVPDAQSRWSGQRWRDEFAAYCEGQRNLFWPDAEPGVCGVADGVPSRVDRLRCLGNSVVPQIAEWIGRRLMECP